MILEVLRSRFQRDRVPISAAELETLERDGPRVLNYLSFQGAERALGRVLAAAMTLLFLALATWKLRWSGAGLLAFVVFGAALTVVIDGMRQFLAQRWQLYSHARVFRVREVLVVGASLESGSASRPAPGTQASAQSTVLAAVAATLVGLPLAWFTLSRLGWANWDTVFANRYLPLCMLFVGAWRLLRGFLGIVRAKRSSVGTLDLFVDSDEALDTYALALGLSLLLVAPFGAPALIWVAYLVVGLRLVAAICLWWQQRRALALLQRRIRRTHPNARLSQSRWDGDEAGAASRR